MKDCFRFSKRVFSRLSNVCAAIGCGQLEVLDDRVAARRAVFQRYSTELDHPGITFMPELPGTKNSRWLTAVSIDPKAAGTDRETIRLALARHGIEARPLWKPMHLQPMFADARYLGGGTDARLFETGLCLPSGSDMSETDQGEVIDRIKAVLAAA